MGIEIEDGALMLPDLPPQQLRKVNESMTDIERAILHWNDRGRPHSFLAATIPFDNLTSDATIIIVDRIDKLGYDAQFIDAVQNGGDVHTAVLIRKYGTF